MKNIKSILLPLAIALISLNLFAQHSSAPDYQGICIQQNGHVTELSYGVNELKLERKAFNIEFDLQYGINNDEWNDWTVLQVSATQFPESTKFFEEGEVSPENPFLSPGSGLAGHSNAEYDELVISNYGCHYIFYNDDSSKRATILQKKSNELIRFKWTIDTFYLIEDYFSDNKQFVSIEESEIENVYLLLFIDKNDNDCVDPEEYHLVNLSFR